MAQCWCYKCAGRIVCRMTYRMHGRKDKPDSPIRRPLPAPASAPDMSVEPPELSLGQSGDEGDDSTVYSSSDSDIDSDNECNILDGWPVGVEDDAQHENEANGDGVGRSKLTPQEILVIFLDWMLAHKVAVKAALGAWNMLRLLVPKGQPMPSFHWVRRMCNKMQDKQVQRIDVCRNDCIAYWNSTHLSEPYRHEHRSKCPVCNEPRWLVDPRDGVKRPSKVLFFFPCKQYVRSLFSRASLVQYLYHDGVHGSEGHVTQSRGFQAKVINNPVMAQDHRNLAFIGTTDGIPYFEDQKRGAWPFILRCANLPDGLAYRAQNAHLHLISANEYWINDPVSGLLTRYILCSTILCAYFNYVQ